MNSSISRARRTHLISRIGLRKLVYGSSSLVLLLVAIVSGALLILTTHMHSDALQVRKGMASVRSAEALKVHLLNFSRMNSLLALTGDQKYAVRATEEETTISEWLNRTRSIENTPDEQERVRDAQQKIDRYLTTRKLLAHKRSLEKAVAESSGPLEEALAALDVLVKTNTERSDRAIAISAYTDHLANQIAIWLFIFLFVLIGTIVAASIQYLYRPIIQIHSAILAFSKGEKTSRAPKGGIPELQLITNQFNELAEQTLDFDRKRVHFLMGTAHDLRNPLTALKTAVLLFKSRFNQLTEKQRYDNLGLIERQVIRLENMTSSFLDAIHIESGDFTLNIRRIDLTQVLNDVMQLWSAATDKHKISSTIPHEPLYLDCDPVRIEQIITNLISNAIKYSPEGGMIEVVLVRSGEIAKLSITDHGIGIASNEIQKIFEPFHRTIPAQQLVPGVGIGLWVTKRLVEAHHGSIEVDSSLGKGSTFTIRIPIEAKIKKVA